MRTYEKDVATISVVNFKAVWGKKDLNIKRIKEHIEALARRGSDIIVLPETAICGYENDINNERKNKMHTLVAELFQDQQQI